MEDAAFRRDRLRTVLPRLQERLADVQAAEYAAQWEPDFEKVQAQRDELTREYAATYPKLVAQLVDLFGRVEAVDREISRINGSAPPGEHRRLLGVELTARGLEHFTTASPSITLGVQLPDFERSTVLAWPLPSPSMAVQVATSMIHHAQARIGGSRARSAGGPCVKSTGVLLLTMTQWRVPERSVKPPRTAPCRRGVPPSRLPRGMSAFGQ